MVTDNRLRMLMKLINQEKTFEAAAAQRVRTKARSMRIVLLDILYHLYHLHRLLNHQ